MSTEVTARGPALFFRLWRPFAAIASGVILASSFPPMTSTEAAWFGLVPVIIIARFSSPKRSYRFGFLAGFVFWAICLSWLLRLSRFGTPWPVVACGWLLLAAYCAIYTGAFALLVSLLWRDRRHAHDSDTPPEGEAARVTRGNLGRVILIPLIWVGFEYLRSTLFTGFAWNALGISQYRNESVIQIAEWGGVYAVSALLLMLNAAIALTVLDGIKFRRLPGDRGRRIHAELMLALVTVVICMTFGLRRISSLERLQGGHEALRIAVIQGNIPQQEKWSDAYEAGIYSEMKDLTEKSAASTPDLILWPETVVPRSAINDPWTRDWIGDLASRCGPILLGSMSVEKTGKEAQIYNSSVLFEKDGTISAEYRKRHLVPFGEYLPFDRWIPILKRWAPLGYSCSAGTVSTVFELEGSPVTFSTLICFEDTIAGLARDAVRAGARLLINQTNDAWFEDSAAALQHMSHCIFRCVENRVPAVRAANLGISCFIRPSGMLDETTRLLLKEGVATQTNYRVDEARVPTGPFEMSFYTRYGDLPFAMPCGILSALVLILFLVKSRRRV